tara:strand:- start:2345 stop:2614 length:270 start_codon:yes stop_codon:yes gene_type:complete
MAIREESTRIQALAFRREYWQPIIGERLGLKFSASYAQPSVKYGRLTNDDLVGFGDLQDLCHRNDFAIVKSLPQSQIGHDLNRDANIHL